uniref:PLOD1-3-like GT domain-containing protein n=1 Tax=viral metagenome TaxID=1070528 RepID=A0A6C0JFB6_9ZZZZ
MSKFYYITVATKPNPVLDKIKERIKKNKEKIHVLGSQENRTIGWEGHQNFGVKLREVSDFLKAPFIEDEDIVLFTDAYDVIYCGNKRETISRYEEFGKPIIFGCEKQCNPDPKRASEYIFTDTEFPYLNSGLFIGKVWALKKCILDYEFNDKDDDQRFWTTCFFEKPNLIGLDYKNRLFLNTVDMDERFFLFDKEEKIAMYRAETPMFVHVNGPDKKSLNNYL